MILINSYWLSGRFKGKDTHRKKAKYDDIKAFKDFK